MRKILLSVFVLLAVSMLSAQPKKDTTTTAKSAKDSSKITPKATTGPKPYKEVITDKAITQKGLFTVHKVEDKYYFEIPDSILNQEILAVTRFSRVPGGGGTYGGEMANQQTLKFEKGPSHTIFLRVVTLISVADSSQVISKAVSNSYVNPIAAAFPIAAFGKDSTSSIIEVTDFFKGDNLPVSIGANKKRMLGLNALASDRSYIQKISTYPVNTEIRTVKTFTASSGGSMGGMSSIPSASLPAAEAAGSVTIELNTSLLLLPKVPMKRRFFDPRVGFFDDQYVLYADGQQKVEEQDFAIRYRMEPKEEDLEKYKRGELVEPKKQIIYYIDPATPKQWRPYLIAGINDWQKAFEKAGFKNAIVGKEWPENDSTMSLEDARFSVIRYFASNITNAYGPNVHDPRSGEILESHVGWYHNVMKLVHDWYFIQAGAVDARARKMKFDDELMGQLIRFVSSHEVGHTLGLRHNMGSSSRTPVEKLRDKSWVEANGHTASIMDYARFNYVAQPEDHVGPAGLFPRIGEYDKWAIEWGYKFLPDVKDEEADKKINNRWIIDSLKANPRLWFGGEGRNGDPRAQTEDLGDNSVKASEYGIKNLKRILPELPLWTREEADKYENLTDLYGQLVTQFSRYMGHVLSNVSGVYENLKSVEQKGDVYEATPKAIQKSAVSFLNSQLFQTPYWLLDKNILNKISNPLISSNSIANLQNSTLSSLISGTRLYRLSSCNIRFGSSSYTPDELLTDAERGVWSELSTKKTIDVYRRNLQKTYVETLISILNPVTPVVLGLPAGVILSIFGPNTKNSDVYSLVRGHLRTLQSDINAAMPGTTDKLTKYHLLDVSERIKRALDPK